MELTSKATRTRPCWNFSCKVSVYIPMQLFAKYRNVQEQVHGFCGLGTRRVVFYRASDFSGSFVARCTTLKIRNLPFPCPEHWIGSLPESQFRCAMKGKLSLVTLFPFDWTSRSFNMLSGTFDLDAIESYHFFINAHGAYRKKTSNSYRQN